MITAKGFSVASVVFAFSAIPVLAQDDSAADSYTQSMQENYDHQSEIQQEFGNVLMGNSTYENQDTGEQVVLPYAYDSAPQIDQNGNTYTMDGSGDWSVTDGSGYTTEVAPAMPSYSSGDTSSSSSDAGSVE